MTKQSLTPIELFHAGEAELLTRVGSYREARDHQSTVEAELRDAKTKTDHARNIANEHGLALLEQIHDSVTGDSDPGEYLQAVLNTHHSGQRIGDVVASKLTLLRDQIRRRSIPIGVVGSTMGEVRLGLSAGDVNVRRSQEQETDFDTAYGVRLSVPMTHTNGFSASNSSSETRWRYSGDRPEPYDVGVEQRLSNLRVAGTVDEVRVFNDTPHAPFRDHDTVMHHERQIKTGTGFVPVIVYGEAAVSGLLSALHQGREIASYRRAPNPDDVLAAAISLDIPPEAVTQVDADALKTRLHEQFREQVSSDVWSVICSEANRRKFNSGGYGTDWLISASPQVMKYAGIEVDEIIDAVRKGIERSVGELRADDPADRLSWIFEEKEYRLLEAEARIKALGLIAVRYGITIEPSQLKSETLTRKLAERLEVKRAEQQWHEQRVRERPWLYRSARTT